MWDVVGAGAQSGVGVWFGSGELGLLEEAPPSSLPLFLPVLMLFTPHNLLDLLETGPSWELASGDQGAEGLARRQRPDELWSLSIPLLPPQL